MATDETAVPLRLLSQISLLKTEGRSERRRGHVNVSSLDYEPHHNVSLIARFQMEGHAREFLILGVVRISGILCKRRSLQTLGT